MSKELDIRKECCDIWNNLKDKTKMIDYLIESKQQIADLEAKLAEKERQIKGLGLYAKNVIDFAVEKLEAVKSRILMLKWQEYLKRYYEIEDIDVSRNDVLAIIDNQIEELKKEMK